MSESISFFLLALTSMTMHEMDAMRCKEWRIFPVLSSLNDKLGETIFIFAHILIFFFIFQNIDNQSFRKGFDVFCVIHLGLHLLLFKHQNNLFKDWISWTIIGLSAVFGLLDFVILLYF